jgi:hypothetical protein
MRSRLTTETEGRDEGGGSDEQGAGDGSANERSNAYKDEGDPNTSSVEVKKSVREDSRLGEVASTRPISVGAFAIEAKTGLTKLTYPPLKKP